MFMGSLIRFTAWQSDQHTGACRLQAVWVCGLGFSIQGLGCMI